MEKRALEDESRWVSDYDLPGGWVTLTRADGVHWTFIRIDEKLSHPSGDFQVFRAESDLLLGSAPEPVEASLGDVVKVVIRLDSSGDLAVVHPDFNHLLIGSPTLWPPHNGFEDPEYQGVFRFVWNSVGSLWHSDEPASWVEVAAGLEIERVESPVELGATYADLLSFVQHLRGWLTDADNDTLGVWSLEREDDIRVTIGDTLCSLRPGATRSGIDEFVQMWNPDLAVNVVPIYDHDGRPLLAFGNAWTTIPGFRMVADELPEFQKALTGVASPVPDLPNWFRANDPAALRLLELFRDRWKSRFGIHAPYLHEVSLFDRADDGHGVLVVTDGSFDVTVSIEDAVAINRLDHYLLLQTGQDSLGRAFARFDTTEFTSLMDKWQTFWEVPLVVAVAERALSAGEGDVALRPGPLDLRRAEMSLVEQTNRIADQHGFKRLPADIVAQLIGFGGAEA